MGNHEGQGTGHQKHVLQPPLHGVRRDLKTGVNHTQVTQESWERRLEEHGIFWRTKWRTKEFYLVP